MHLSALALLPLAISAQLPPPQPPPLEALHQAPLSSSSSSSSHLDQDSITTTFTNLKTAVSTLQSQFFNATTGDWPSAIDWTAAVVQTFLASATHSLSTTDYDLSNRYFTELVAFYYGQHDESLKGQAFDDILWVVLGWLEAVKMIDHRENVLDEGQWTGLEWKAAWAERAKVFYELATTGWDEKLCGGGMVWSPWLEPYKNAITNELYISASVSMYLYHPQPDPQYLVNAIEAHNWLKASNMTDAWNLYTDGFHISHLDDPNVEDKICDARNEMVYTYNQGVLLSGLRGLTVATGDFEYLQEGVDLVNAVIKSEGTPAWLAKDGLLTEKCDPGGYCSQNGQTFKGIFFHHLTIFCEPLPVDSVSTEARELHSGACESFSKFITHNAAKAWSTRDSRGVVGSWWGAPAKDELRSGVDDEDLQLPDGAVDYQNGCAAGEGSCKSIAAEGEGGDLNDRGRGRTVESHAGGLAVLRALFEVVEHGSRR